MRSGSPPTACYWPLVHAPGRTFAERSSPFLYELRMRPRRVAAKIEWHWGEHYPCVDFMVTNTARPAANAAFYNKRRTWELWMNKGKGVIRRRGSRDALSPPAPSAFSFMPSPRIWATFAAAVRCVDWVMRLVVTRSTENLGNTRLRTHSLGSLGAP